MVKWKKMNKKMAGLLLGVMMLFTASTTAFAYVDESAEAYGKRSQCHSGSPCRTPYQ